MDSGDVVGHERGEQGDGRDASNVLVLSAGMDKEARRAYFEAFAPTEPAETRVLAVNYTHSPDDWLADWRAHVGTDPAECVIVSVGETTRAATSAGAPSADVPKSSAGSDRVVRSVETPDDLTGLGITLSEYLSSWGDATEVLVAFDSLTVLLQYVDLQRAFRFLHVMTNRTRTAGATGHYHLDPGAHDDQTVATLSSLFDAVVEYEDDGWSNRSR